MLAPALLEKRLKAELAALQKANKACFNCSALVRLHNEWYCIVNIYSQYSVYAMCCSCCWAAVSL